MNFIESILPNAASIPDEFLEATIETLYMTLWTAGLGFVLGLGLGVWLVLTQPKGLKANAAVYGVLDKFVNIFRSIPFVIMIALLVNITRLIAGTSIGTTAAIVPLVVATVPFYARQIQNALVEVNPGVIEAAQAMGLSTGDIVFRVYLKEALPGIIRVSALSIINVIGLTAMAGTIGGGGLGNLAITRGYNRFQTDVTIISTIIILIIVFISQAIADRLVKKVEH
ncbi:ABC transporter permease [Aerococcus urinaeequi]|jgi:D-methionine transport system permease protein|uniref:ABC transporter permease n=3 Tax=Aerococcaceae TaxID=186827 RepID=A0A0U4VYF6_9LACT|nr:MULTISPECIES: methionine ABC transporter permease [Aerococcus]ALZ88199.1 methionine ABC transporter permease [Aerococcus urinaeequi]AMB98008.1 methionine ABC transporter permease [Aerococcus urinaeequi]MBR2129263.1 ABC transporter permease [Aerococcus sp.]MCT1797910.1 ABC transporter permease [Aerococcus viridans]MCY7730177.1 ABC transporter permease [Aerococcus urinaeequi]